MGSNHDDNDIFVKFLYLFQHLNAADARQLDIQQHQIGLLLTDQTQRILAGSRQ